MACALLAWLFAALPARAQQVEEEPAPAMRSRDAPRQAPLLPLAEVLVFNTALSLFNRIFLAEPWAQVSGRSIARNLGGPWELDGDAFNVNFFGHPLHGAQAFMAARSAGFSFYPSILSSGMSSLLWELAGENKPPSVNDLVNHTFGGALLGEALYRTAFLLERSTLGPQWLRLALAVLLDPLGSLNRAILGERYGEAELSPTTGWGRLSIGVRALVQLEDREAGTPGALELHVGGRLRAGLPGAPPRRPFEHFDFRGELAIGSRPWAAVYVSGLLAGSAFESQRPVAGTFGLFANYDFSNRPALRVTAVSAGPGILLLWQPLEAVQLQASGVVSVVVLGAAGLTPVDRGERDYHLGPGAQAVGEVALVHARWGALHAGVRQYLIGPGYAGDRLRSATALEGGVAIPVFSGLELTLDLLAAAQSEAPGAEALGENSWETRLCFGLGWSPGSLTAPRSPAAPPR